MVEPEKEEKGKDEKEGEGRLGDKKRLSNMQEKKYLSIPDDCHQTVVITLPHCMVSQD